jgi:hypothetical protein
MHQRDLRHGFLGAGGIALKENNYLNEITGMLFNSAHMSG